MRFFISDRAPQRSAHQFWSRSGTKDMEKTTTKRPGPGVLRKGWTTLPKKLLDASASTRLNFPYKMDWVALAQNFWTTAYFDGWDEQLSGNMPDVSVSCLIMRSWTSSGVSDKWFQECNTHQQQCACTWHQLEHLSFLTDSPLSSKHPDKTNSLRSCYSQATSRKCVDYRVQCGYTTVIM